MTRTSTALVDPVGGLRFGPPLQPQNTGSLLSQIGMKELAGLQLAPWAIAVERPLLEAKVIHLALEGREVGMSVIAVQDGLKGRRGIDGDGAAVGRAGQV